MNDSNARPPLRIGITGASGLVGSELSRLLRGRGHSVAHLVRPSSTSPQPPGVETIDWDPETGASRGEAEPLDALVHLAGESVAGRWSQERRRRIHDSRVLGTRHLVDSLKDLTRSPSVFVCASASGYYGDRGDQPLTEDEPPGDSFLAQVCQQWELEASRAEQHVDRVVTTRLAVVLAAEGGALEKMLTPFKLGLGGRLGSGRQYMPWISLEDTVRAIDHLIEQTEITGPVNLCAPEATTNREFTNCLGEALNRPTILPVPATALRVALGDMADEMLLASARMVPQRLVDSGFSFLHPTLEEALREVLS